MFKGTQKLSMDSKGRISIPTKYRAALTPLVLVPNPIAGEPCLLIYPPDVWQTIEAEIAARPNTRANRMTKRKFLGAAEDITMDSNGRVLIKPDFRNKVNLGKKVLLIGQGNKLELWSETEWEAFDTEDHDEAYQAELEALPF